MSIDLIQAYTGLARDRRTADHDDSACRATVSFKAAFAAVHRLSAPLRPAAASLL